MCSQALGRIKEIAFNFFNFICEIVAQLIRKPQNKKTLKDPDLTQNMRSAYIQLIIDFTSPH